jgi:hypothetical protein
LSRAARGDGVDRPFGGDQIGAGGEAIALDRLDLLSRVDQRLQRRQEGLGDVGCAVLHRRTASRP